MFIPEASNSAGTVDSAFSTILFIEVALLVLVTFAMVFFVIRYNRRKKGTSSSIEGNTLLEITWTVIPTLIVLVMFYIGWKSFDKIRHVPKEVMTIKVTARQWSWHFSYENGKQSGVLRVPVGKPIKMLLTSMDVIHSFYIPAFRIKEDCVPKMQTYLWFTATEVGTYDIFCTEYCGLGHSGMLSKAIVMPEKEFYEWYAAAPAEATKISGRSLVESKGCLGCHTTDGTKKIGPSFKGIFGREVEVITNGKERKIVVDEAYLKRSMLEPGADVVKGFPDIMPSQKGVLSDEEINTIIEYIEELK